MNEFRATLRYQRISPRKARIIGDMIRGKNVLRALDILSGSKHKAAEILTGVVRSARANAVKADEDKNLSINPDTLVISELLINGGPIMRRFRPMSMGRAGRIRKRTSHITVTLREPRGGLLREVGEE